jgi:protocatechuate 3,4-dioxygenase, beta subunit
MGSYSIGDLSRREILKMSVVLTGSSMAFSTNLTAAEAALQRTPAQILGPFYPLNKLTKSSDLTRVPGRTGHAAGQVLNVMGAC